MPEIPDSTASVALEWRRHWTLALAACLGFSFLSLMTPSFGVFMGPLGTELGWNRTTLSSGFAISSLLTVLASPVFGGLADRFGTRRMGLLGLTLTALAIALFATITSSLVQWFLLWALWGFCSMLISATIWATAVSKAFSASRGLALGVAMSGAAIAQVIAPPLANMLIVQFGWRAAFLWLGLGWGGIAVVVCFLFLYDADGMARPSPSQPRLDTSPATRLAGLSKGEALRSPALWRIAAATLLILTVTIAVSVHQFPILVEAGVTREMAAWLASLAGIAGIVGKLLTGHLLDRFHARWIGGVTLASTAIAYPLLMGRYGSVPLIVVGMIISGYAAGTKIQLCTYLTGRYAGLKNYGAIFGAMSSMIGLAAAAGPLLAGFAHDRFGSYVGFLWFGVAASLVSAALIVTLGRYPDWQQPAAA